MKKIITVCLVIFMALSGLKSVHACPHWDEEGNLYFKLFNADGTESFQIFFLENHFHETHASMVTHRVYRQIFGFPLIRCVGDWYFMMANQYPTVAHLDSRVVSGLNFNLDVGLVNAGLLAEVVEEDEIWEMTYNITVSRMNDHIHDERYQAIIEKIQTSGLNQIAPDVLNVTADITLVDMELTTEVVPIDFFPDPIEVQVYSHIPFENAVAVNLEPPHSAPSIIEVVFDEEQQQYIFEINESGTFILVENDFDPQILTQLLFERTQSNSSSGLSHQASLIFEAVYRDLSSLDLSDGETDLDQRVMPAPLLFSSAALIPIAAFFAIKKKK